MRPELPDLTGQLAIVTGNGRDIAESLIAAGAIVKLAVKTERQWDQLVGLIDRTNGRFSVVVVDTLGRSVVEQTIRNIKEQHGFISLVVNVVDRVEMQTAPWQIDPNGWSKTLESDLRRAVLWTQIAIPQMANGGRIINVASDAVFSRLTHNLTIEANAHSITLFSIDPAIDHMGQLVVFLASGQAAA